MDISHDAQEGLQLCGESVQIGEKSFKELVRVTIDIILGKRDETCFHDSSAMKSVNLGSLKEGYYGLVTLVLEAAKRDSSLTDISTYLEESKWDSDRIDFFSKIYSEAKPSLQALLNFDLLNLLKICLTDRAITNGPTNNGDTRSVFPHVVDLDWRLDYYVKNKFLDKVNKPTYLISLKTEENNRPGYSDVQFSCSVEQLQDLVGKLKDACKSLEKAAQM